MFEQERIYIAGPECFYKNGYTMLAAMRRYAESQGFGVTLPNDHPLDMDNPDLQKRADCIFADLKRAIKETTVIIADLEAYRGSEADSGTIYEIGMAYANGIRCYGYTRDKRPLAWKDQQYFIRDKQVYNEKKQPAPYFDLPFSPTIVGSTKIIQGDFFDCLKVLMADLEEEWKAEGRRGSGKFPQNSSKPDQTSEKCIRMTGEGSSGRPIVYLADLVRYEEGAGQIYEKRKELCRRYGLEALTPLDLAQGREWVQSPNRYTQAADLTENYLELIRECDAVVADLNNYRGYECANDVGFECGVGLELKKKLFGYMQDTRPCIEKIPHLGEEAEYRDMTGSNVENFNYPANLMFACSMKIYESKFEAAIKQVAESLNAEKCNEEGSR